jgi:hypothetical protein
MTCTHGWGDAATCSSCLGIPARLVTIVNGVLCIDGIATRAADGTPIGKRTRKQLRGKR